MRGLFSRDCAPNVVCMRSKVNIKILLLALLVMPSLALNGPCDQFDLGPGGQICTAIAVPSVVLTITGADGEAAPTATIAFTINGQMPSIGDCTGTCDDVVLAFEATGRFDIEVSSLGYVAGRRSVVVQLDGAGCHPVTEEITLVLERDQTVGVLSGAWRTSNAWGTSDLRFGANGEIIGAILYNQTAGGDGNFYVAYNGHNIRGVPGQFLFLEQAADPTRSGDVFNFVAASPTIPVGFENAILSADFYTLYGTLSGVPVTYTRLLDIPQPLLDQ